MHRSCTSAGTSAPHRFPAFPGLARCAAAGLRPEARSVCLGAGQPWWVSPGGSALVGQPWWVSPGGSALVRSEPATPSQSKFQRPAGSKPTHIRKRNLCRPREDSSPLARGHRPSSQPRPQSSGFSRTAFAVSGLVHEGEVIRVVVEAGCAGADQPRPAGARVSLTPQARMKSHMIQRPVLVMV